MKLIIAGGRSRRLTHEDIKLLDEIYQQEDVTTVISGDCHGVDREAAEWAERKNIFVWREPAQWAKYGRRAGPIRNEKMAEMADAVVLFPGGVGTNSMFQIAKKYKLRIYDYRHIDEGKLYA